MNLFLRQSCELIELSIMILGFEPIDTACQLRDGGSRSEATNLHRDCSIWCQQHNLGANSSLRCVYLHP